VSRLEKKSEAIEQWKKDRSYPYPDQQYTSQRRTFAYEMRINKPELMIQLRMNASRNTLAHSGNLNMKIERCHFAAVAIILAADYDRLEEDILEADCESFDLKHYAYNRSRHLLQEAKNANSNA
jgi:hypothetical protein